MSVAERERPAVAWTPRERALLAVLQEQQAAADELLEENNALRADVAAMRLGMQLGAGMVQDARERLMVELPDVAPLVTELTDQLARAVDVAHRTLAGVRLSQLPPRTPSGIAVPGFEPEAGDEQSIGGGADSSPATSEVQQRVRDPRPQPQRILEALEAVTA